MSIRITLDNPPEFYTNLDIIRGQVVLTLSRPEHIGAVIVKLEGESKTALAVPAESPGLGIARDRNTTGDILNENHKILYKVVQAFPDDSSQLQIGPFLLNQGQHLFPFQFKFPFNNACGNPEAMARLGGIMNAGLFGSGGFRVMDGTKQLMYSHVTKTLPPSFTGFPGEAEIRYYVKVTIQRPGIFKENWRYQIGLKFQPIEPPRPPKTNQEAYARRPYTFLPRSPSPAQERKKRTSFFGYLDTYSRRRLANDAPRPTDGTPDGQQSEAAAAIPPSVEMSARLPHPAILTCNKPIPLRLLAKKLVPSREHVYLVALQIDLVGRTTVRCHNLLNTEVSRWVIMSRQGLSIPVSQPEDAVGTECLVPDTLWNNIPLPNTVMPSFVTCNLSRDYQLEVKLGLAWGNPPDRSNSSRAKPRLSEVPQEIHLPLHFSSIQVFSGLTPPPELVEAMRQDRRRKPAPQPNQQSQSSPAPAAAAAAAAHQAQTPSSPPPSLPPRPAQPPQQQPPDALYPPQLQPGQAAVAPPYDDAPPTYEEAMAEEMTGPMFPSTARPAYSGVTDENEPSTLAEGGGSGGGSGARQGKN
ncbi:hypothetical protein VTK56DRAFT_6590 [Thermocarpiscus australiensis]